MFARTFFFLIAAPLVMAGCSGASQPVEADGEVSDSLDWYLAEDSLLSLAEAEKEEEREIPVTIDETFDDFIFNFAGKQRFQLSRIAFPLHLNAFGDDMIITRDEWQHQTLFNDSEYYTVFFHTVDDTEIAGDRGIEAVDFENINLLDSVVRTLHFDRQDGKWRLTRELMYSIEHHVLAGFLSFYRQFTTDSLFRRSSLMSTIRYVTTDPDDDFTRINGTISADQWDSFAPELPTDELTNINYGQSYGRHNAVVMLKRGISNGLFDELHFSRGDHGWRLNYYEN